MKKLSEKSALELEVLGPGSKRPVGRVNGKSNWTMSTGLSLPIDFHRPTNTKTSEIGKALAFPGLPALPSGFPARTSVTWETLRGIDRAEVLKAAGADSSLRSWKSSTTLNPLGWLLKTCRRCSVQTIAKTLRSSSGNLPNAVMWDSGECLMLNISESPKNAVAYSWSRVLDATPQWTSWLTAHQWNQYLHRLARAGSQSRRMLGLAILLRRPTNTTDAAPESTWALSFSLLRKGDGIRWLSGPERLKYMGFPADWMRPTLKRLTLRETHYPPHCKMGC